MMNASKPLWKPLENCAGLPGTVEDWLSEPGSLTERIRARCRNDFCLRVHAERELDNVKVFADHPPGKVFCREITLGSNAIPLIFARTRIPAATVAAHPWLGGLGDTPLGARLFDEPGYMRGRFMVACLQPGDELYDHVNAAVIRLDNELWARRARVELDGDPLEICECFLPGLI